MSGTTGELFHADGRSEVAAEASSGRATTGDHRGSPAAGYAGFEDLVNAARSVLKITPRPAGDLAIAGYASGTAGLPAGRVD